MHTGGRGIAVEAATAAIDWACAEHDLAELWASTSVENGRSRRVLEKLGMTLDRTDEREVVYRLRRQTSSLERRPANGPD